MSTILKALRRLEQERTKSAARPLREQVTLSQARPRGPWRAWLAVAAALLLGFTATWAVLATFERPGAHHASVSTAPPPEASRSASDVAAAGSAAAPPAVAAPPPTVRVAAGAPAAGAVASPDAASRAATPEPPVVPTSRAVAPPPAAIDPTPQRVVVAPPPAAPERVFADDPVLTAPIPGRAPRLVEDEPASPAAADVPVDVVRTSWHPQADRRAAWVAIGGEAPREVREGEWVGAYEVRTIEPDGVLFADGPLLVHEPVGGR